MPVWMIGSRALLESVLLVLCLAGAAEVKAQVSPDPAAVPGRADAWLKPYVLAGDFSGVALLAQGDQVLFEKAYGMADPQVRIPTRLDTRFRIASLSKTFTAAAIERLASQGKLRYGDTLSTYVAGIPNGDSITIEQLLAHESGVGQLDGAEIPKECSSHQEVLARLAKLKPSFEPGKKSEYSNEGYFLLANVIERASGQAYAEYLQKNVFGPLGMKDSGVACRDLPDGRNAFGSVATAAEEHAKVLPFNEAALDGAGSVFSTIHDLYIWLRAVDSHQQFSVSKLKYPFGWGKRKYSSRDLIEQSGQLAGFTAHMAIYPKDHIYAVLLSNVQSGFMNRVPADLEAVLFGGAASLPPALNVVTLGERSMRQYVGRYHSTGISYAQTLEIRDGQLAMHWGSDPFWREMAMIDGDTFFLRADYARIHFERNAGGLVERMVWSWPGGAQLAFDKDEITPSPQPITPDAP